MNKYKIIEDRVVLFLETKNGQIKLEVFVDVEYLDKVNKYKWHLMWREDIQNYYVKTSVYQQTSKRCKTLLLHRYIMDAKKGEYIDHRNHSTLDNRKFNLRVTNNSDNNKNKNGKHKNNTSGYRNVCWLKNDKKWVVQLQVDGKNTRLGYFDDVHEAGKFAEEMRNKYYGEFAGKN